MAIQPNERKSSAKCQMRHSLSLNKLSSSLRRSSAKLLQKIKTADYYSDLISSRLVSLLTTRNHIDSQSTALFY